MLSLHFAFKISIIVIMGRLIVCDVEILPKDLKVQLHNSKGFTLRISDVAESTQLAFKVQHNDVLTLLFNNTMHIEERKDINKTLHLFATGLGKSEVEVISSNPNVSTLNAYLKVEVYYSYVINIISDIVGWIYFAAWAVSFYPQIYINYKRKSVVGLNFDYTTLNILGYIMYSIFNLGLFCIPELKEEYFERYPRGVNPVQMNDVLFAVHGCFGSFIIIVQCYIYERGDQKLSKAARLILLILITLTLIVAFLSYFYYIHWLDFIYWCSYIKLTITLMKYVPQVYMNYTRQSTLGWSIENVLLDLTGGILSLIQMFLLSYNYNDWISIFGDPTKFGLGLLTIFFDVFFILQHYVFYNNAKSYDNCQYEKGAQNEKNSWNLEMHS